MHFKKGIVTSAKGDKTVTVEVATSKMHPKYGKFFKVTKKFYAHDEENRYKEGDQVTIRQVRPISKMKSWLCVPDESVEKMRKKEVEKREQREEKKAEMVKKMIEKMKKDGIKKKEMKKPVKKVEKKAEVKKSDNKNNSEEKK